MRPKSGFPSPDNGDVDKWRQGFKNKKDKPYSTNYKPKEETPKPELPPNRAGTKKPFNLGRDLRMSDFDLHDFSEEELRKSLDFFKNPPNPDDLRERP